MRPANAPDELPPTPSKVQWREMRCVRYGRRLQKVEENALGPGKRLEIKCGHRKLINWLVGGEPDVHTELTARPEDRRARGPMRN